MVKCPNCGSTAQMKLVGTDYPTFSHCIETWRCGCDCVVRRTMKVTNQMVEYPDKRVEVKEKFPTSLVAQGMIKKMNEYYRKRGSE